MLRWLWLWIWRLCVPRYGDSPQGLAEYLEERTRRQAGLSRCPVIAAVRTCSPRRAQDPASQDIVAWAVPHLRKDGGRRGWERADGAGRADLILQLAHNCSLMRRGGTRAFIAKLGWRAVASAADAMTFLMTLVRMRMGPLNWVRLTLPRK